MSTTSCDYRGLHLLPPAFLGMARNPWAQDVFSGSFDEATYCQMGPAVDYAGLGVGEEITAGDKGSAHPHGAVS